MGLRAKPAVDDKFSRDVLAGAALSELVAEDVKGTFSGRITSSAIADTGQNDQDVFVNIVCDLRGDYFAARDVVDDQGRPTDAFRDNILDCLGGNEGLESEALSELPTFNGLLTEFERELLLLGLHEECPDTFCGGDFLYFLTGDDGSLHCTNDGTCALEFTVAPFGDDFANDPTAGLSSAELTSTSSSGLYTVTATGSKVVDGNVVVEMRCDLFENTFNAEDVYDRVDDVATDSFRDHFLACIGDNDGAESTVLPRLPLR